MIRRKPGNAKPWKTVKKTQFQHVRPQERKGTGRDDLKSRSRSAAFVHLSCTERCITFADHLMMMLRTLHAEVVNLGIEVGHACYGVHFNGFMDLSSVPVSFPSVEEAKLVIRVPT